MTDIVKRLRDLFTECRDPLVAEAADEIEKLRREWQAEMVSDQFKIRMRDEEIERLRDASRLMRETAVPRDEYELALGVIEQMRGAPAQVVPADYTDEVERLRLALRIILQKDPRYVP